MKVNSCTALKSNKLPFIRKSLLVLLLLSIGIVIGFVVSNNWPGNNARILANADIRKGMNQFINPLLECEVANTLYNEELKPFKYKIQQIIDEKIAQGTVKNISIYFRDLNNGPWWGLGENEDFAPASLLKVPLMMAYFKLAESDPQILTKKIKFESLEDLNVAQNFQPKKSINPGETYTVEELIKMMIVYSDNNAKALLDANISENDFDKIYADLGVNIPGVQEPENFMTVKQYATFFRILYNASYLREASSNVALQLLSKVDFDQGLVAGLPKNVTVSHKFGEMTNGETKQLHDCGIIYYPKRPYLLCIMTRGNDFEKMANTISDISKAVYQEIKLQSP